MKRCKNPVTGVVHWLTNSQDAHSLVHICLCGVASGIVWLKADKEAVTCRKCLSIKPDLPAEDVLSQWEVGRKNAKTAEEKTKYNVWDNLIDHVVPIVELAKRHKWCWFNSPFRQRVKYINVRIDMRNGHCIITDNDGNRINPEDLAAQRKRG